MGVAVLSPENCLRSEFSHHHRQLISPPRSKPRRSSVGHVPSQPQVRSGRRKQNLSPPPSHVRILKRGEDLSPPKQPIARTPDRKASREGSLHRACSDSAVVCSAGSDPIPNPLSGFYAGSAFFTSPPPSSVPVPAFFSKKNALTSGYGGLTMCSAEDATVDLRRILRLE